MDFALFAGLCKVYNLQAQDCGNGHWRILGGPCPVNWYPFSKKRTIYVNGATSETSQGGNAQAAIQAALGNSPTMSPGVNRTKRPGQNWRKRTVERWFKRGAVCCHVCRTPLTRSTVTIDHYVPLDRGGSNLPDNTRPACVKCNTSRGNKLGV